MSLYKLFKIRQKDFEWTRSVFRSIYSIIAFKKIKFAFKMLILISK